MIKCLCHSMRRILMKWSPGESTRLMNFTRLSYQVKDVLIQFYLSNFIFRKEGTERTVSWFNSCVTIYYVSWQLTYNYLRLICLFYVSRVPVKWRGGSLAPGLRGIALEQTVLLLRNWRVAEGWPHHALPALWSSKGTELGMEVPAQQGCDLHARQVGVPMGVFDFHFEITI